MSKRDYYEVLAVARDASDDEIRKSFRRLAMKHHPDRNSGDKAAEEQFKEAREAYEVLSDAKKRAAYDQFGHAADGMSGAGGYAADGMNFSDVFGDIFGDIFGGGRRGPARGSDLRYDLEVSLEQAVQGATIEIVIPTHTECKECNGSGARRGASPVNCEDCGGYGQIRIQQGFFTVQQTCPSCRGRGKRITNPCSECRGQGRSRQSKKLSIKIPPGVDNNDRIRLSGEGEAGEVGASAGDLYVQIAVKPHPIFGREGTNLHCEVPVSFVTVALGGDIDVPTLTGRTKLSIPAGTQSGKVFKIKNMGVPPVRGGAKGDLVCRVLVETPVNLVNKQKELLLQFEKTLSSDNKQNPRSSSWFDKVKKFFEEMKL